MQDDKEVTPNAGRVPAVGITMGDAAGIGPEIVLRSLSRSSPDQSIRPIIIGDLETLQRTAREMSIGVNLRRFAETAELGSIDVVDLANLPAGLQIGVESAPAGKAAGQYIETGVELWRGGTLDAIATAPINKRSLAMGGYNFPGHTEFLAHLTDTAEFAMSFFAEKLRVVLLSTHLPLAEAIRLIKAEPLVHLIQFTDQRLSALLGKKVRIAVAGLNPHASEGGMFGSEEAAEIRPAIDQCAAAGIDVSGPFSPDTIFLRGYQGEFDAVVACYHDQATIAVKCLSFGSAVNVTLGLPLIRTSVDHGTAFDRAGKGTADPSSMRAAIGLAGDLALLKRQNAAAGKGNS